MSEYIQRALTADEAACFIDQSREQFDTVWGFYVSLSPEALTQIRTSAEEKANSALAKALGIPRKNMSTVFRFTDPEQKGFWLPSGLEKSPGKTILGYNIGVGVGALHYCHGLEAVGLQRTSEGYLVQSWPPYGSFNAACQRLIQREGGDERISRLSAAANQDYNKLERFILEFKVDPPASP